MCGRYSLESNPREIAEAFALAEAISFSTRYNIAPTQHVPVVRLEGRVRRFGLLRWGLTGAGPGSSRSIINARSETASRKPSFRSSFRRRRCLVPATGFYEWQKLDKAKQPFHIRRRDGAVFAFAGLWDTCRGPEGDAIESFAILTCPPNRIMEPIHDRMPVILDPGGYAAWLDPRVQSPTVLRGLMVPAPDDLLTAFPVSTHVNAPDHDDAACVAPL